MHVTNLDDVVSLDRAKLRAMMASGFAIDPTALDDTEYHGVSLGLPRWIERLSWKTFQKVFHRDPRDGRLRGWNVRVEQRGIGAPTVAKTRATNAGPVPFTFGHYEVVPMAGRRAPVAPEHALLIDYGRGRHGFFDVTKLMRDPLVALREGDASLLLGFTYVELGPLRITTPSYFALSLEGKLRTVVDG